MRSLIGFPWEEKPCCNFLGMVVVVGRGGGGRNQAQRKRRHLCDNPVPLVNASPARPPATWMFKGASETTDTLAVRQTVGGGGFTMLNRGRKQHLANTQNGLKSAESFPQLHSSFEITPFCEEMKRLNQRKKFWDTSVTQTTDDQKNTTSHQRFRSVSHTVLEKGDTRPICRHSP